MTGGTQPPARHRRPAGPLSQDPAVAARIRQLTGQAEHRRNIADFHARHLADQQARINALLLEAIAALAGLLDQPPPAPAASPQTRAGPRQP